MSEERKMHFWPWIVAVLIGLPVLYVVSFGPACWLVRERRVETLMAARIYRPLVHVACSEGILAPAFRWYAEAIGPRSGPSVAITNWMNLTLLIADNIEAES